MFRQSQTNEPTDVFQDIFDRLKKLDELVTRRVLPDRYEWIESGGDLYIKNVETGSTTLVVDNP